MSNRFVLLAVILAGIVFVWFGAKHITAARDERPISTLTQYRMVGAVLWISAVCMYYLTEVVVDVKVVQDHDLERGCENRNLNRITEIRSSEARIELLEDRVEEAESRVPILPEEVPGYSDYDDPAVLATVDALITATNADRVKDITDARNDLDLERAEHAEFLQAFPLEDCNGDGHIEVVPGGADVRVPVGSLLGDS